MANQMTGRVFILQPTQSIPTKSGNIFTKREIVLDCTRYDPYTGERGFENFPMFEFIGEKANMLDGFKVGDVVTITFDVQGQKSTTGDRYFNSVRGYRIELRNQQQPSPVPQPSQQPAYPAQTGYQAAGYQAPQLVPAPPQGSSPMPAQPYQGQPASDMQIPPQQKPELPF